MTKKLKSQTLGDMERQNEVRDFLYFALEICFFLIDVKLYFRVIRVKGMIPNPNRKGKILKIASRNPRNNVS